MKRHGHHRQDALFENEPKQRFGCWQCRRTDRDLKLYLIKRRGLVYGAPLCSKECREALQQRS